MYKVASSLTYYGEGTLTLSKNILSLDYGIFKAIVKITSKGFRIAKTKVITNGSILNVTTESGRDFVIKPDGTILLDGDIFKYSDITVSFKDDIVYRLVPDKDIINLVREDIIVMILKLEDPLRLRKTRLVTLTSSETRITIHEEGKPILQIAGNYLIHNRKLYELA